MNVVVLPIVVTVVLLSILGVYSASTNSEYDIARTSMDSMAQAAERRNEIIHAVMDGQSLTVANHGMRQSGITDDGFQDEQRHHKQGHVLR